MSMLGLVSRHLGSALVALAALAAAPATAADLSGEGYGPDRYVDEERYAEPYRVPARPEPYAADEPYGADEGPDLAERPGSPEPYERDYEPERRAPRYEAPRFAERSYPGNACLPRWRIRTNLLNDGWVDLRPLDRGEAVVVVRARREETGRVFLLDVDRCTGRILHARRDFLRSFGAYEPRREWRRGPY